MIASAYQQARPRIFRRGDMVVQTLHTPSSSGAIAIDMPAGLPTLEGARLRGILAAVLLLGLVGAVTAAAIVFRQHIFGLVSLGYLGVFFMNVVASATLVVPIPGLPLTIGAALVWNPVLVALAGAAGSAVADTAGYLIGASSNKAVAARLAHQKWYAPIERWMEHRGFTTLFLFAAIPNPLFDVAGLVAGSMGYSFRRFVVACWLGKITKYLLVVMAGYWGVDLLMGLL